MSELFNTGRTYGVTVNGRIHTELGERRGSPPVPNELAGFLDRLDGETRFSVSLWELPAGTSFDRVDLERWPVAYLQAAGNRDRMMIELRRDMESHHQHYVIGKCDTTEPDLREEIRWDAYFDRVNEVEVFTAAEAVPLFLSYWQTNELPADTAFAPSISKHTQLGTSARDRSAQSDSATGPEGLNRGPSRVPRWRGC